MRRRAFGRRRGSSRGLKKRERFWRDAHFTPTTHAQTEVAFFELLGQNDYQEGDSAFKTEHLTLLRTLGRCEFDSNIDLSLGDQTITLTVYGALIVTSQIAMENAVIAATESDYDPRNALLPLHARVLQHFNLRVFSTAYFTDLTPNVTTFWTTGCMSDPMLEWDVRQKVKMKRDDALYLALSADITVTKAVAPENAWINILHARTLWAE